MKVGEMTINELIDMCIKSECEKCVFHIDDSPYCPINSIRNFEQNEIVIEDN